MIFHSALQVSTFKAPDPTTHTVSTSFFAISRVSGENNFMMKLMNTSLPFAIPSTFNIQQQQAEKSKNILTYCT